MLFFSCLLLLTLTFFPFSVSASSFLIAPDKSALTEKKRKVPSLLHPGKGLFRQLLWQQYRDKWQGTRYLLGGSSLRGIDCSALMQHLFRESLNLTLARTTSGQIKEGVKVDRHNLKVGDLIFFRTGPTERHVGVYIGNEEFIHASSSRGVTVSTLENQYWQERYITARRIVS